MGLRDEQEIEVGGLRLQFLHVPGHCPDHLVIYEPSWRILITGDLLFVGKVGGTANDDDARIEWASLRRLLDRFPDEATVWPGHDYGVRPSSTIGLERAHEPVSAMFRSGRVHRAQARLAGRQAAARPEMILARCK